MATKLLIILFLAASTMAATTITYSADATIQRQLSDFDFTLSVTETVVSSNPETTEPYQLDDCIYDKGVPASNTYTRTAIVSQTGVADYSKTFTSSNSAVATIDTSGNITGVSNGNVYISATCYGVTRKQQIAISDATLDYVYSLDSFATGSYRKAIHDYFSTNIPESFSNKSVYSAVNDTTHTYTRNISCYATTDYEIDITCVPVKNTASYAVWGAGGPSAWSGCLIDPSTVLTAYHCVKFDKADSPYAVGAKFYFVASDNTVYERTVDYASGAIGGDIYIMTFSEALPAGIKPAKLLPSTYLDYFPQQYNPYYPGNIYYAYPYIPAFNIDKMRNIYITPFGHHSYYNGKTFNAGNSVDVVGGCPALYLSYASIYHSPISGDSGTPVFAIDVADKRSVLLMTFTTGGTDGGGGVFVSKYITEIEAAITEAGKTPDIDYVDLSSYNNYGD